jgi:hypothetical protein
MDILTPAGQKTLADEQKAAAIYHKNCPNYRYIQTPKNMPALVDGVLISDKILAVVETKCRYDMDLDYFNSAYKSEWLVTYEKISAAGKIGRDLGVPLVGFLYIVQSNCLLIQQITDEFGEMICTHYVKETETQKTVNGGKIVRPNCFISMKGARVLYG